MNLDGYGLVAGYLKRSTKKKQQLFLALVATEYRLKELSEAMLP